MFSLFSLLCGIYIIILKYGIIVELRLKNKSSLAERVRTDKIWRFGEIDIFKVYEVYL